jgi:arylformamidase
MGERRRTRWLPLLVFLVACQGQTPPIEGATDEPGTGALLTFEDLTYDLPVGIDDSLATLDLFRPDDGQARPLVLLVHGGSWVGGDKAGFSKSAPDFIPWWIDRGYAVAAVNFRLATPLGQPQVVTPTDQADDIAHALAWLLTHAEDHHLDAASETTLVGYSSGAHLVALLGADGRYLERAGLDPEQIGATVSLDVHAYDVPFALELMVGSVVEQNMPLIRHLFGQTPEEQLSASPIAYLDDHVAPAMLVSVQPSLSDPASHGYIVHAAAEHYAQALTEAGYTAATFHDASETHASLAMGFGAEGDAATEAVGAFLDGLP